MSRRPPARVFNDGHGKVLRRFSRSIEAINDEQKVAQIILETGGPVPSSSAAGATAGGDSRRMRGIPLAARGVSGVMPGTDPYLAAARRR